MRRRKVIIVLDEMKLSALELMQLLLSLHLPSHRCHLLWRRFEAVCKVLNNIL